MSDSEDKKQVSSSSHIELMHLQEQRAARAQSANVVVKGKSLEWQQGPQGLNKFYSSSLSDCPNPSLWIHFDLIRKHSGAHVHQGGTVIYVVKGKGWTTVDNEKVDWQEGDLIVLPLKSGGVRHQHFNASPGEPCNWLAFSWYPFKEATGSVTRQVTPHPDWLGRAEGIPHFQEGEPYKPIVSREGRQKIKKYQGTLFDALLRRRDEQRLKHRRILVRGKDIPWEMNRHGKMKWYLHPDIDDTAVRTLILFVQEIPPTSRTGKEHCQGGRAYFVLQGHGYTMIDGVRYDWEEEDLITLPIKGEGVDFQHFNSQADRLATLIACEANLIDSLGVDGGAGFEHLEDCPEFQE